MNILQPLSMVTIFFVLWFTNFSVVDAPDFDKSILRSVNNLFLGGMSILLGLAFRIGHLIHISRTLKGYSSIYQKAILKTSNKMVFSFIFIAFLLYIVIYLCHLANFRIKSTLLFWYIVIGVVLFILFIGKQIYLQRKAKNNSNDNHQFVFPFYFRPRPITILTITAVSMIMVAYQLLIPMIYPISQKLFSSEIVEQIVRLPKSCEGFVFSYSSLCESKELRVSHNYLYQIWWAVGWYFLLVALYLIEYAWIVRPLITAREDRELNPNAKRSWADQIPDDIKSKDDISRGGRNRLKNQALEQATLPALTYNLWMPTIITTINLGFDDLDHRGVIQAMLVSLRHGYYRKFMAWTSMHANIHRFVSANIILVIVVWFAGEHFDYRKKEEVNGFPAVKRIMLSNEDACSLQIKKEKGSLIHTYSRYEASSIARSMCGISLVWGNIILPILYYPVLTISTIDEELLKKEGIEQGLVFFLVHKSTTIQKEMEGKYNLRTSLSVYLYHIVLIILIVVVGRWIKHRVLPFNHRRVVGEMDDLLDSLAGNISVTKRREYWKPAQWVYNLFSDSQTKTTEKYVANPRAVELAFMNIIEDIRRVRVAFPISIRSEASTPSVEITFIFDELDKLGTNIFGFSNDHTALAEPRQGIRTGRDASLNRLLSDMKRILSSAPARFVFVGGREQHDEWLLDTTQRLPLLASVFSGQVYLRSLLVDHPVQRHCSVDDNDVCEVENSNLTFHTRVKEYLVIQYAHSWQRYRSWIQKRWDPFFGLESEKQYEPGFCQAQDLKASSKKLRPDLAVLDCHTGEALTTQYELSTNDRLTRNFTEDYPFAAAFVHYLAYRSLGNSKRLKELLSEFIRPAARFIQGPKDTGILEEKFVCRDILLLTDHQLFKIQLSGSLYNHLRQGFEAKLLERDDKIVIALFYLTDFLIKFHSRAFSSENLEQIDELVDVHRAPDIRHLLGELVEHFSERYLYRVLNGMYVYRFRSDFAKEIQYLSKISESEMAAFNFTLDESQTLRNTYQAALRAEQSDNADLVAKLGELFEYDQDYDAARHYYRKTINILDKQLEHIVGSRVPIKGQKDSFEIPALKSIFTDDNESRKNANYFLSWGCERLRLMLNVGMTYESTKNYERAFLQYRQCVLLSNALISAYLQGNKYYLLKGKTGYEGQNQNQNQILKHLNIIYQPIFATAWICEKWSGAIDTAATVIEEGLRDIRSKLPFLRERGVTENEAINLRHGIRHANFALVGSQLHKKAGNLYFFKGSQSRSSDDIEQGRNFTSDKPEGYLLRSHYHYAVSLHEMRRYIFYRKITSKHKFSLSGSEFDQSRTISGSNWPDFERLGVADGIMDLAENTLARLPVINLYSKLTHNGNSSPFETFDDSKKKAFLTLCDKWLGASDKETRSENQFKVCGSLSETSLLDWFGSWKRNHRITNPMNRILEFGKKDEWPTCLNVSLYLSIAGAEYVRRAGYLEQAAREYLQISETVNQIIWWICFIDKICHTNANTPEVGSLEPLRQMKNSEAYLVSILSIGVWCLEKVADLLKKVRRQKSNTTDKVIIGDIIPPAALTVACGLAIVGRLIVKSTKRNSNKLKDQFARLDRIISGWIAKDVGKNNYIGAYVDFDEYQAILCESLRRNRYPMLNQLNALKLLIDSFNLGADKSKNMKKLAIDWVHELREANINFNAPFHFTPDKVGMTIAATRLWLDGAEDMKFNFDIEAEAEKYLRKSREMYTMGRSYYSSISDLYFLYDDFNDRHIHRNQALQMAGSQLGTLFESHLLAVNR